MKINENMPEDIIVELFSDPFYQEYFLTRKMLEYAPVSHFKVLEENWNDCVEENWNAECVDERWQDERRRTGYVQALYECIMLEYAIDKDDACCFLSMDEVWDYDPIDYLPLMMETIDVLLPAFTGED